MNSDFSQLCSYISLGAQSKVQQCGSKGLREEVIHGVGFKLDQKISPIALCMAKSSWDMLRFLA